MWCVFSKLTLLFASVMVVLVQSVVEVVVVPPIICASDASSSCITATNVRSIWNPTPSRALKYTWSISFHRCYVLRPFQCIIIPVAIGANSTLDSLEDEDEVLYAMAEELTKFTDLVGGPAYTHLLFPVLEGLASVEETAVREKAVQSLGSLAKGLPDKGFEELVKVWKRLASSEWWHSRASACGLFHFIYPRCSPRLLSSAWNTNEN